MEEGNEVEEEKGREKWRKGMKWRRKNGGKKVRKK